MQGKGLFGIRWNDIRIRHKFLLSLSPLVFVLVLQSGLSVETIRELGWTIADVGVEWTHRMQVTEVDRAITGAQAAVRMFLLSNRAEDWSRVEGELASVSARIEEARLRLERAPDMNSRLSTVVQAFDRYRGAIYRIRDLSRARDETFQAAVRARMRAEEKELSEIMRAAYHEGDAVSSFYAGSCLAELTEINGAVSLFMAGEVTESRAMMAVHYGYLVDDLKLLSGNVSTRFARKQIDTVEEQTTELQHGFDTLLETTSTRDQAMSAEVVPAALALATALHGISQLAARNSEEMSNVAGEEAARAVLSSGGFAVVGIVAALLVAFWAGRSLARPLVGMTRVMTALASGDISIAVPDARRADEIGQMANALEVFKESARRERDLQAINERLRSTDLAKSRFFATMSHELRTPMTGVMGMADLLFETPLNEMQRKYLGAMRASAKTLLTVLNDLLDYSKIDADKLALDVADFDAVALIRDIVQLFTPKAIENSSRLVADFSGLEQVPLRGDPIRIKQILGNLVSNAVKFTQGGTVTIRFHQEPAGEASRLTFEVVDTGIGIPEEKFSQLFDPFFQVGDGRETKRQGTGLGLFISQRLAGLMGGEITVASRPSGGSIFAFTCVLPKGREKVGKAAKAPRLATVPQLDILVAEDNPVNSLILKVGLEQRGHRIVQTENGQEALGEASRRRFDLIIMDMQMPVMDGPEATRRIRCLPSPAGDVPIIALTADAIPGNRPAYMAAGLSGFLTKPIDWNELDAMLMTVRSGEGSRPAGTACVAAGSSEADPIERDRLILIRSEIGEAAFAEVIVEFVNESDKLVSALESAVEAGDLPGARRLSHGIKGMFLNFGGRHVGVLAAALQSSRSVDEVQGCFTALREAIAHTNREFERYASGES